MNETTGEALEESTIENDLRHEPLSLASGGNHLVIFTATNITEPTRSTCAESCHWRRDKHYAIE